MQGDQLKMDSGAPPCYGDNTLQPPKSHTTGCSTKVTPLCTLKLRATGQSVHLIQHRSSKGQTGTLSLSSATDRSSSPVDCQTVSFSSKFWFFFFPWAQKNVLSATAIMCKRLPSQKLFSSGQVAFFHNTSWCFLALRHLSKHLCGIFPDLTTKSSCTSLDQ